MHTLYHNHIVEKTRNVKNYHIFFLKFEIYGIILMFIFVKIIILMSKCIAKSEVIAWQSRGHGFEPRYLHQKRFTDAKHTE